MFFIQPGEMRKIFKYEREKFNVMQWIIFNTNYSEEYDYLKKFECHFSYSLVEKEAIISCQKLKTIMKQLEEAKYISWIYKSKSKYKPSILKNLILENIITEQQNNKPINTSKFIVNDNTINMSNEVIERIWRLYPNKKGKNIAFKKISKILKEITEEELIRAVERYSKEIIGKDMKYIKHGSTFFNYDYIEYLDKNYNEMQQITNNTIEDLVNKLDF